MAVNIEPAMQYPTGTRIIDCGDNGEITDITDHDGETIYTIEFQDGKELKYPATELEIGIVDGTIRVAAP